MAEGESFYLESTYNRSLFMIFGKIYKCVIIIERVIYEGYQNYHQGFVACDGMIDRTC